VYVLWNKIRFRILFQQENPVDRAHGSVDHDRTTVYGSTVDHERGWLKGSLELVLGAAPVSGSSPMVGEKEKEALGVPTVVEGGRRGAIGSPAMVDHGRWVGARCGVSGGMER
jgi:hypothetical protein